MKLILLVISVFVLSACAVYPTTRTYFEPNAADGILTRSTSCGYNKAAKDTLKREINGVHLLVHPVYKEKTNLLLVISFYYESGDVSINTDEITIVTKSGNIYAPKSAKAKYYARDRSHPHSKWVDLSYPVISSEINELRVNFSSSALKINNKSINLKPFRFKKTTKSDIYYGSINC